ncbi:ATP-binding cassette domain-containing protein [candidate division GN15 bacterium]|nr:ATP-binding cassette domain-containing protein [candidate division GN15 bacterium]
MIRCHNLTYRYPGAERASLDNLSLEITPGESLAVMGPNGSGKSTLALLLAGLLEPTEGELTITPGNGESDNDFPPVGLLFQNPDNQMVSVVVDKEVAFALENRAIPMADMEQRVWATLESFGIQHLGHRLTTELSGGEKQRVALAALMVYDPPVLVLDEPDSYLDVAGRRMLREQLTQLHDRDDNLIEVRITQYPQVARQYNRVIRLDAGRIAADGAPDEVLGDPVENGTAPNKPTATQVPSDTTTDQSLHVALDGVCFGYDRSTPILTDITLALTQGEICCLVGPTGSGKSTLGLLLAGLLKPDRGEITIRDHSGKSINRPGIVSAVLQQPERQFFLSSCAEEIAFGPGNRGTDLTVQQVDSFLDQVGLPAARFRDRDPLTLSVGEKRRLAFAVILALEPRFVVFDEPTAALDTDGVALYIRLMHQKRRDGLGAIVITHEGSLVRELADRVLVLSESGRLTDLPAEKFFADPDLRRLVAAGYDR